jgi:hypothetical protein
LAGKHERRLEKWFELEESQILFGRNGIALERLVGGNIYAVKRDLHGQLLASKAARQGI